MQEIYNRINAIDKVCYSQEYGLNAETKRKIVEQVVRKFCDKLKGYKYCDNPEKIKIGYYIKYINYDMDKVNYGLVINITKQYNENISLIMKSTFNNKYWKIDPYKYFLFYKKCESKQKKKTNKLLDEYLMSI